MNAAGYGTGLRLSWDTRNESYPVGAVLDLGAEPVDRQWWLDPASRVNQGNTPKCVGASIAQELAADPVRVKISQPYTMDNIYNAAQKIDEWPGEAYDGTSLNAGMKAARAFGYITEWRWAMNVADILQSLAQLGPVLMAGPWLTGMFTPDNEGRVHIEGTAGNVGHCYLIGESQVSRGRVFIEQTWGAHWSVLGWRGWLTVEDVGKLLSIGTQAAIITGRADPAAPTPPVPPTPVPPVKRKTGQVDVYSDGSIETVRFAMPSGVDRIRGDSITLGRRYAPRCAAPEIRGCFLL